MIQLYNMVELFNVQLIQQRPLCCHRGQSMAASGSTGLAGWCADEHEFLMHMIEERSKEKLSEASNHLTVGLTLAVIIDASFLYTTLAS